MSFETRDLGRYAKLWFYFVTSRLIPSESTNWVTKDRAILMYCILEGESIDIGHIILQSMNNYMNSHTKARIPFPMLVTKLCAKAGVFWGEHEEIAQPTLPMNVRATSIFMRSSRKRISDDENFKTRSWH